MDMLGALQWPASVATLVGSWLIASTSPVRRHAGFWVFLVSNALWIAWGWNAQAPALMALQLGLAVMNVRGAMKTEDVPAAPPA